MSNDAVREAVEKTTKLFQSEPRKAQVSTPPVTAYLTTGVTFRIKGTRGEVQTDMPPAMGGQALAETPGWHMRAALASCIGTMIATRAAQLGISLRLLEVTVLSEVDYRGVLGMDDSIAPTMSDLRPQIKIAADGVSPAALADLVRWGEEHSPVARTIKAGQLSQAEINAS
jgi:uncharacterized OsmC-like protein